MHEIGLDEAVEVLQKGQPLLYPTETCYGLGVRIDSPQSIDQVFEIKGRSFTKPISVLVSDYEQARTLISTFFPLAQFLWQKLMPGPLTLILPAAEHVSPVLTAGTGWLGVRQSSHPLAHALVESLAQPITTTSANPSGQPPAYTLSELKKYFSQTQLAYLAETSQEQKNAGLASTVLKVTADDYSIVREGEIPAEHIQALANEFYKSENKKT